MKIKLLFFSLLVVSLVQAQYPDSIWQRSLKNFEDKNYHGAIEDIDALLKIAPGLGSAYYNRGIALAQLGDVESACVDFRLAEAFDFKENKKFIDYTCDESYIRNLLLEQFYKKQKVYPELGYRPEYTHADTLRGALRPERTCFDVLYYDLYVKIIPKGKKIEGRNDIYFYVTSPTKRIQIDLFENYSITGIIWNGKELAWHRESNAIFIEFPEELNIGEKHTITFSYKGKPLKAPNPPWDGGFVWKHDKNNDLWISVACEQLGASSWWPTKDHMTDKPDSMQITLDIPKGYNAVSNGNLRKYQEAGKNNDRFTWFVSYPINNYNVTFYIGKYTAFSDTLVTANDTLSLDYNVLSYNLDIAQEHFIQTRDVVSFYIEAFGPYPFTKDGFGLVESSYAGMEHQSAIAYGNGYKNNDAYEYRNQKYDYIIVHEGAHEWWGNSVTAVDMADIWIHEGFATYAEYLFLEKMFGKEEYLYELVNKSRYIFNVWPMVQNRNVNENAFASNDVYNKGAMLLHCLRCSINNDSLFFSLLRGFCIKYKYKTVTSDDFITFVNQVTGENYSAFFSKFLYDTKLPVLTYSYLHDNGDLLIKYKWSGVEEGFIMPFGIETSNKESFRLVAHTTWQEIRIPKTEWFNFYTILKGYEGCKDNSFTYFNTHLEN